MTTKNYGIWKRTGIPIYAGEGKYWGNHFIVDGTNGKNSNLGDRPDRPFATIQKAVTQQIANPTGLGDMITIFPGTYAESIVASALSNVVIQGVNADAVIVAPTASHALLVGTDGATATVMTNSAIKNMTFLTPSTSNPTYAAATICYMTKSVIEDCKFMGTTITGFAADATIGLQIGNRTDTEWEFHEHSRISRCEFTTSAGRNKELGYGILVGAQSTGEPSYKGFKSMIIEDCLIGAYDSGILLNTGSSSCNGSVVRRNVITSHQGGNGPDKGIVSGSTDGTDAMCLILDNRIVAIADCIENFSDCNVMANIVSVNAGSPASETGQ